MLDGLERVLVAYHRWDAAQMRDDKVEDAESIIKDRDLRACTDPRDDDLLRGLLACTTTKILLSSRLLPLALEDRMGNLSKGVRHIHLNGLHPDDALRLVRHAGVTVDDELTFRLFMGRFGYHSLLVKLVAGRINKFRRGRGSFDAWYVEVGRDIEMSAFDDDLKQNQTHILKYALEGLDAAQMRFLSQIAAFGDAVPYDTLAVFNPFVRPAPEVVAEPYVEDLYQGLYNSVTEFDRQYYEHWIYETLQIYDNNVVERYEYEEYLKSSEYRKTLSQFDSLLNELEDRGLLRWEHTNDTYDMHPVVRGAAFARLESDDKATTFERIRGHLEALPADDLDTAEDVSDLSNTIAIYRALLGAGKHDAAAHFFWDRLSNKLHYNLAAYYTTIELLMPLFTAGMDQLPPLSDVNLKSGITNHLSLMYYYIGRTEEALALQRMLISIILENNDLPNLIVELQNFSLSLRENDQLSLALRVLHTAVMLAETTGNQKEVIHSTFFLLGLYADTGQWIETETAYDALQDNPPRDRFWQADVEKHYAESLIYRRYEATAALERAEVQAVEGRHSLIYRQIKGWQGEAVLQLGDTQAALRWFEESLQLHRKSGSDDTAWVLGGMARAYALLGDGDRARAIIEDNDFDSKEVINVAEVYHILGEHDQARQYALHAYKRAWADGPPYVWWWHLERAKAVLDALGEPYPDLPPYDPARIGKFPYEDEILAVIEREKAKRAAARQAEEEE
ncbi:MAG: hypothetical protein OHK0046_34860 [Anaerolineae bacterium]